MRIAIVNDMGLAVECMRRVIEGDGRHSVAWVARDGLEAVSMTAARPPELILMDLIMPVMDGVEATARIMRETPCPILIVTSSVGGNAAMVFEAMGAGALDAVRTPILTHMGEEGAAGLLAKIATIEKLTRPAARPRGGDRPQRDEGTLALHGRLLAIGSSTGGPKALAAILEHLPLDFPAGIVIVQHVDAQFAAEMANWLNAQTPLTVRLARDGDRPMPGTALLAGTNDHLVFDRNARLKYTREPVEQVYRPSADALFDSVAAHWRGDVAAALLTGMGRDGGAGLLHLRERGAYTLAEHASTCAVYGMPKAAVELNAAVEVLPIHSIAGALIRYFTLRR